MNSYFGRLIARTQGAPWPRPVARPAATHAPLADPFETTGTPVQSQLAVPRFQAETRPPLTTRIDDDQPGSQSALVPASRVPGAATVPARRPIEQIAPSSPKAVTPNDRITPSPPNAPGRLSMPKAGDLPTPILAGHGAHEPASHQDQGSATAPKVPPQAGRESAGARDLRSPNPDAEGTTSGLAVQPESQERLLRAADNFMARLTHRARSATEPPSSVRPAPTQTEPANPEPVPATLAPANVAGVRPPAPPAVPSPTVVIGQLTVEVVPPSPASRPSLAAPRPAPRRVTHRAHPGAGSSARFGLGQL
jgi:hypothetical protein